MGLITKKVNVVICDRNMNYYKLLGYDISQNIIEVDVKHLSNGNSSIKVTCQCDNCGKFLYNIIWQNYIKYKNKSGGTYCNSCSKELYASENGRLTKLRNSINFEKWCFDYNRIDALNLWSERNIENPSDYSYSSGKEFLWKCENGIHDDYYRSIDQAQRLNFKCSYCTEIRNESRLQEKIRSYLNILKDKHGFTLNHGRDCSIICQNPETKGKRGLMPYDNELSSSNFNLIIETQGEQHYKITNFHNLQARKENTTPQYQLEYQQWKDQIKKEYVESLDGYFYLAIPYWTEKDGSWQTLIDDMLEYIFSITQL